MQPCEEAVAGYKLLTLLQPPQEDWVSEREKKGSVKNRTSTKEGELKVLQYVMEDTTLLHETERKASWVYTTIIIDFEFFCMFLWYKKWKTENIGHHEVQCKKYRT